MTSCGCRKGCDTNRCGCFKSSQACSGECECSDVCNNVETICRCTTGCETRRCGCFKGSKTCNDNCKCSNCKNQAREELQVGCSCTTGCESKRCGCVNKSKACSGSCKCSRWDCRNPNATRSSDDIARPKTAENAPGSSSAPEAHYEIVRRHPSAAGRAGAPAFFVHIRGARGPVLPPEGGNAEKISSLLGTWVRRAVSEKAGCAEVDEGSTTCYYLRARGYRRGRAGQAHAEVDHTFECQLMGHALAQSAEWHPLLRGMGWASERLDPGEAAHAALAPVQALQNAPYNLHILDGGINKSKMHVYRAGRGALIRPGPTGAREFELGHEMEEAMERYIATRDDIVVDAGTVATGLLRAFAGVEAAIVSGLSEHPRELGRVRAESLRGSVQDLFERFMI